MRSITDTHSLTGDWDDIVIKDENLEPVQYAGVSMFFTEDIYIRGKEGQEEILIEADMSPMIMTGASNNGFPFQVKGTGSLNFITLN